MSNTLITPTARAIALTVAKGSYQRSLVAGTASWAGSDLVGKASRFGGRYHNSRQSLLNACRQEGLRAVVSPIGAHGRLVATILTTAEARRIAVQPMPEGDARIEGRLLQARIEQVGMKATATSRKQAREQAQDDAALATLTA